MKKAARSNIRILLANLAITFSLFLPSMMIYGQTHEQHNESPIWPSDIRIPGERPGIFGNETIVCYDNDCTNRQIWNVSNPTITSYLVSNSTTAVVIAPGGGYVELAIDKGGTDVAKLWLNQIGISAFVLKYRVPLRPWLKVFGQAQLMDAQRAMRLLRHQYNFTQIGFMGFSAGGHLTGHLNVAFNTTSYPPIDLIDQESCRPDFSMMIYPWKSVSQPPVNQANATADQITNATPPTFLVQTQDDPVHVENSIFYYLALKNQNVASSELHVYPNGGHGYGICSRPPFNNQDLEVCTWPNRAEDWMKGILKQKRRIYAILTDHAVAGGFVSMVLSTEKKLRLKIDPPMK